MSSSVVNDYKPLMHTWSLGVEEQFYMFYPLIFLFFNKQNKRWILPSISILTIISLLLFIYSTEEPSKFYLIQYRFFELSLGGLGAIIFKEQIKNSYIKFFSILIVIVILSINLNIVNHIKLIIIIFATTGLLISEDNKNSFITYFLENTLIVWIGKISFSFYMWHQIILAFTRYSITKDIQFSSSLLIFILVLTLSILSYNYVEQPFRNKDKVGNKKLIILLGIFFIVISSTSLYIYKIKGIIRNVPELDYYKSVKYKGNIHISYNERIYDLNKKFNSNKIKVLIIGNSFARDWANIILESKLRDKIEISYIPDMDDSQDISTRIKEARYIFFSELSISEFNVISNKYHIDTSKCWNIGTKNFGPNNGIHYNKTKDNNYCEQRTKMDAGFFESNNKLKKQWGVKYIDLIGKIIDSNREVSVFTPECKFISQDCRHLTHAGAVYFSQIIEIDSIIIDR